jgi:hypothetical protein
LWSIEISEMGWSPMFAGWNCRKFTRTRCS